MGDWLPGKPEDFGMPAKSVAISVVLLKWSDLSSESGWLVELAKQITG
ncbi:MAG: hypothetical protein WBD34_10675 [Burkholderiaceae bacterium]